jgi:N-acetylglucosaminyldiphosphoundecaprenol N-acetyl-beta-D-mannosaminyltransferase
MVKMNSKAPLPTTRLFDLDICASSFNEASTHLLDIARQRAYHAHVVVTPNVDHIVRLASDPAFKDFYTRSDCIFADGMPVVWASRMTAHPLPERVTGSDLFVTLTRTAVSEGLSVFLIGGMPGQEAQLTSDFKRVYPGLDITIYCPSMQFDPTGAEGLEALARVNAIKPDIVFVCLGMPKQERWALTHREAMSASVVMCVGAAMEFALGLKSRAPKWMQKAGLEWFWRLCSEPGRLWRRYIIQGKKFFPLCWHEWKKQRARHQ